MTLAPLEFLDASLQILDVAQDGRDPHLDGGVPGGRDGVQPAREVDDTEPQQDQRNRQAAGKHGDGTEQVTHAASLPPDLAARLTRDQYNEDQGGEREAGYRKGWNDHARYMLRLLADREAL